MGGGNYDLPLTKEYVPLTPELRNAVRNFASNGSYGREDRPRRRSERLRDEWRAEQRSRRRLWDGSEAHEFKNRVDERLADPETDSGRKGSGCEFEAGRGSFPWYRSP